MLADDVVEVDAVVGVVVVDVVDVVVVDVVVTVVLGVVVIGVGVVLLLLNFVVKLPKAATCYWVRTVYCTVATSKSIERFWPSGSKVQ